MEKPKNVPFYDSSSVGRSDKNQLIYLVFTNNNTSRREAVAVHSDHAYKLALRILSSLHEGGYAEGKLEKSLRSFPAVKEKAQDSNVTRRQELNENTSLEQLQRIFHSGSPETKIKVVRLLSRRSDGEGKPTVLLACHDEDARVRRLATEVLGQLPDEEVVDALLEQLRDSDKAVRLKAIEALEKIGDRSVAPAIGDALNDPSITIRRNAAEFLSAIGDARMLSTFARVLNDEDEQIQLSGVKALSRIGGAVAASALSIAVKNQNPHVRIHAVRALAEVGNPSVVPILLGALNFDDVPEVRRGAAEALGRLGDPSARKHLVRILKDQAEEVSVRASLIKALSKIGTFADIPVLLSLLRDPESTLRFHSAIALGAIKDPAAATGLLSVLETDRDAQVRGAAAQSLGELGHTAASPALIKALTDVHSRVRAAAARALGQLQVAQAKEPLKQALKDQDEHVRAEARQALDRL